MMKRKNADGRHQLLTCPSDHPDRHKVNTAQISRSDSVSAVHVSVLRDNVAFRRCSCHGAALEPWPGSSLALGLPPRTDSCPEVGVVLHIRQNLFPSLWEPGDGLWIRSGFVSDRCAAHPVHSSGALLSERGVQLVGADEDGQHTRVEERRLSHVLSAAGRRVLTAARRRSVRQRVQLLDAGPRGWGKLLWGFQDQQMKKRDSLWGETAQCGFSNLKK